MAKKRVFLDANVIIECFRINVWNELAKRCQLETVDKCVEEALSGKPTASDYVKVDAQQLGEGLHKAHPVSDAEIDRFTLEHEEMLRMDAGDLHLFAYLHLNKVRLSDATVLSTADKGAILRANDMPGRLDWIQSLQELLKDAKFPQGKIDALQSQHTIAKLSEVRTKVLTGQIP